MKKKFCFIAVILGIFLLSTVSTYAEQDNYSEDEKPITFRLIERIPGTGSPDPTPNPPNTGGSGGGSGGGSKLPQTGELSTFFFSFVGTLLLGMSGFIILMKRRKKDDEQEN